MEENKDSFGRLPSEVLKYLVNFYQIPRFNFVLGYLGLSPSNPIYESIIEINSSVFKIQMFIAYESQTESGKIRWEAAHETNCMTNQQIVIEIKRQF